MNTVNLDYINQKNNTDLKHIPGEYGLPMVGITGKILTGQVELARRLYETYGPVSRTRMAFDKGVLLLGPDFAQQTLLDSSQNYSAKMGYKWGLEPFFGTSNLLGTDFDEHKFQRRIMQTGFKNAAMRGYIYLMTPVLETGIDKWDYENDFRFFPNIKSLLLEMGMKVFFGVDGASDLSRELSQTFTDLLEGQMGLFRVELPGFKFNKAMKAKRILRDYIASLIPAAREEERGDMLSYMAKETKPDGSYFTDEELIDHTTFLVFAAHDTTTSTLTHQMYYLAKDQQWQQRLREEGQQVNGGQALAYDDLSEVPLSAACFEESQRLHPSVAVMMRRTIKECELGDYHIPANTLLFQMPIFNNRFEKYWTNPDSFEPDRFLPERAEQKNHSFAFTAFGGGAHKCIGMHFAYMQAKLFTQLFLQRYKFSLPENYEPVFLTIPLPKLEDNLPLIVEKI